jgi:Ring finger domain
MQGTGFQHHTEWVCEACTYINNASCSTCSICQGYRPADRTYREILIENDDEGDSRSPERCQSTYLAHPSDDDNTPFDNITMGIMLGAIGGASLALLRGRSITSGALIGANYGAVGGMLLNQSDRMAAQSRSGGSNGAVSSDNASRQHDLSQSSRETFNFESHLVSPRSIPTNFFFDYFPQLHSIESEAGVTDLDMSYENLLALYGDGHQQTPATENAINSLPTYNFTRNVESADHDHFDDQLDSKNSCSICIARYEVGEEIGTLPCLHMFHNDCIKRWLTQSNTCPICKMTV